jgi:hypothetical protein
MPQRVDTVRAASAREGTSKTRHHVVKREGFAACGADVLLGQSIPAADVPAELRCRKSVCQRLFHGADEDARGVNLPDGAKHG